MNVCVGRPNNCINLLDLTALVTVTSSRGQGFKTRRA